MMVAEVRVTTRFRLGKGALNARRDLANRLDAPNRALRRSRVQRVHSPALLAEDAGAGEIQVLQEAVGRDLVRGVGAEVVDHRAAGNGEQTGRDGAAERG